MVFSTACRNKGFKSRTTKSVFTASPPRWSKTLNLDKISTAKRCDTIHLLKYKHSAGESASKAKRSESPESVCFMNLESSHNLWPLLCSCFLWNWMFFARMSLLRFRFFLMNEKIAVNHTCVHKSHWHYPCMRLHAILYFILLLLILMHHRLGCVIFKE